MGGIVILVIIWIAGALFDKKRKEERRRQQSQKAKKKPAKVEAVLVDPVERPRLPDASQREGNKLEQVLRQLSPELAELADKAREEATRSQAPVKAKRPPRVPPPPAPEPVAGRTPPPMDFMEKAEAAIARRSKVAEAHSKGRTTGAHRQFHEGIRRKAPIVAEVSRFPREKIREAIVWTEILGPPKAMTIDDE